MYSVVTFKDSTELRDFLNRVKHKKIISISESCCVFGGIQRNYTLVYTMEG